MDTTVKQGHNKFYMGGSEEHPLAMMTFVHNGKTQIIIDHTEVSEALRGQSIGDKLLEAIVGYAREKELKIIPLCPFAKARLEKNHEKYEDVLK